VRDLEHVVVLGTDGKLWLEETLPGIGWTVVPPPRSQIDANVYLPPVWGGDASDDDD
jgi:hypothetical protein